MSAHDRWLAGRNTYPCHAVCGECSFEWDDTYIEEYGAGWLERHEQCPKCGSDNIDAAELDALNIQERKLDARGEDY